MMEKRVKTISSHHCRLLLVWIILQYLISEAYTLQVSILTQNVWFILIASIPASDRAPLIAEYLKSYSSYDIICLQEVWSTAVDSTYLDILLQGLRETYPYNVASQPQQFVSGAVLDSGLLILSKYPIQSSFFHTFGNKTSIDNLAQKGVMLAHVEIPQGDDMVGNVIISNTHLQAGGPDEIRYFQTLEAVNALDLFVDSLIKEGAIHQDTISQTPIIAVGDFNTDERDDDDKLTLSPEYVQLVETLGPTTQDLYRVIQGDGPLGYTISNRSRLDYVFGVSGNYTTLDANIDDFVITFGQTLVDVSPSPVERLSDHLGSYAKIDIPIVAASTKDGVDGDLKDDGDDGNDFGESGAASTIRRSVFAKAVLALAMILHNL